MYGLGNRVAASSWQRGVFFLDWTFITATDGKPGFVRWQRWASEMLTPETRRMPLFLDSSGFRRFTGEAPKWATYENYLRAIDLTHPTMYTAYDVVGDTETSVQLYDRMRADGYGNRCIPIYQVQWDKTADTRIGGAQTLANDARNAVANAHRTVADPVFQHVASHSHIVAIGGLVSSRKKQSPCPLAVRHIYFSEILRLMPDLQLWGLGMASPPIINGMGKAGYLPRFWSDSSKWIHDARDERIQVLQDGLLKNLPLTHTGAHSFFTLPELAAANLRSMLGAYDDQWAWPPPDPVPTNMADMDAVLELKKRIQSAQTDLWQLLGADFDKNAMGTEADAG